MMAVMAERSSQWGKKYIAVFDCVPIWFILLLLYFKTERDVLYQNTSYLKSDLSLNKGYITLIIFCLALGSCEIFVCVCLRVCRCIYDAIILQLVKAVESARK
jgi:hypothetical protein